MNGMLLAAGRGERMEPLSSWCPKPALEVLGRPLLGAGLDALVKRGCTRVVVNLHRHPEQLGAAARGVAPRGVSMAFSWEPELLGSAGGIAAARGLFDAGPVLAANADVWSSLDLAPLLAAHDPDHVVLALIPHPDPSRWTSVTLDGDGRVREFIRPGEPASGRRYLFSGFQLLGERVIASLPDPPAEIGPTWRRLAADGALRGVVVEGAWREAGSPASYHELIMSRLGGDSWRHPQALASQSGLQHSAVGAGCRVDGSAELVDTVLTAGATVAGASRLRSCVVAGPVRLLDIAAANELILPSGRFPLA